jgi:hypothetical protein
MPEHDQVLNFGAGPAKMYEIYISAHSLYLLCQRKT